VTWRAQRAAQAPLHTLGELGDQLSLYARAIAWIPRGVRRYPKEIGRLLAEVSFGSGALIVILGTAGVMVALNLFVGSLVGLQGFRALDSLGVEALTGFITAYFNTRDIAPLVAAGALTATLGAGFTAQLGACGSPRRSTRSRSWRCPACRT
jgi:phospholipid/cholesterol/gamma-HCH transport system permease protein